MMKKNIMNMAIRCAVFTSFFATATSASLGQTSNRLNVSQLDVESQQCMKCHDGSGGNVIELRPSSAPVEYDRGLWMRTKNHSIGMSYTTSMQENPTEYVSEKALNENIKLFNGKVGCLSCHVAKSRLLASLSAERSKEAKECSVDLEGTKNAFHGSVCTYCHVK